MRRVSASLLCAVFVAACVVPALASVTIKGDMTAANEVAAAFKKLHALPGFRVRITTTSDKQVTIEFSGPNYHVLQPGGIEMIRVGNTATTRSTAPGAPNGWKCAAAAPRAIASALGFADPTQTWRQGVGTVQMARGRDTTIERTPAHTIVATGESGATGMETVYVGSQTGLPRRIVLESAGQLTIVDYYDYGASITITLPQCTAQ
ncbi:MAG TPA: hypothetical protein VEP50_01280 [bacterium]|nr:hypothetical protein [bacterium]